MKAAYDNHKSLEPYTMAHANLLAVTKGAYSAVIDFIKEQVGEEIPATSALPKDTRKALHLAIALYCLVPNIEHAGHCPEKLKCLSVSEKNGLSEMDILSYYLEELEGDWNNDCQILNRILPAAFDDEEVVLIWDILKLQLTGAIDHPPRPGRDFQLA